jgi:copper(I)-binding protein
MKAERLIMQLLAALLLAAPPAWAQVSIDGPWARATAPGATVAGGYMAIRNAGADADRLVGASSPASARVELHVHLKEGEVMRMREVKSLDVPANGAFELKPGGAHLMFIGIRQPLKEGDRVPVTLKFERGGEVKVEFHVVPLTAGTGGHRH